MIFDGVSQAKKSTYIMHMGSILCLGSYFLMFLSYTAYPYMPEIMHRCFASSMILTYLNWVNYRRRINLIAQMCLLNDGKSIRIIKVNGDTEHF